MQRILEHTKLIERLKKNEIELKFIKYFELQKLIGICTKLENDKTSHDLYLNKLFIQKELINNIEFVEYLKIINNKGLSLEKLDNILQLIQEKNKEILDYSIDSLIETLNNENLSHNTYYNYLEYFSNKGNTTFEEQNIIASNLEFFNEYTDCKITELTEDEKKLFVYPFISDYNLMPENNIKRVYELLTDDVELKEIIHFLYSNDLKIPLDIRDYEYIHNQSNVIRDYLNRIYKIVDNENMYSFLLRWKQNGCNIYDLKILESRLKTIEKTKYEKIFCNRSSYINFIFGTKLSDFPLENINQKQEKILIYAISNNKKGFLKLIQENQELFMNISQFSLLFNEDFYYKYININTLTYQNLIELKSMTNKNCDIMLLKSGNYTFEEIKILYGALSQYYEMYNYLLDLKIDDRLIIIKQLLKRNLLDNKTDNEEIKKLSEKLKIKNLYKWMENEFSNIKDLRPEDAVEILIKYNQIEKFIPEITNQIELQYINRNAEKIQQYKNLNEIKEHIEEIDTYWIELIKCMDINQEFINNNKENIKQFLLKNGAKLALIYYNRRSEQDKEPFKRIVKSELMGEFKKLKYYTNDLMKEIEFNLKDYQINEWTTNNRSIVDGKIEVSEYDDFYNTMILGEQPKRTCLSYIDGAYNKCLLACFDSNKKILYAKINGKIVARAMVRLTKGKYSNLANKEKSFSFVDLEKMKDKIETNEIKDNEHITIFLEIPYISGISSEEKIKIMNMFVRLLQQKALGMNALLVLNNEYSAIKSEDFIVTKYYMYISKSKAGAQYLDSLSGQASVIDEGQYKANTFMIWQN